MLARRRIRCSEVVDGTNRFPFRFASASRARRQDIYGPFGTIVIPALFLNLDRMMNMINGARSVLVVRTI